MNLPLSALQVPGDSNQRSPEIKTDGTWLRMARLKNEFLHGVTDPQKIARKLKDHPERPDIFTFWQKLPRTNPQFDYPMEWDNVAALTISDYQDWWKKKTNSNVRRAVRKAAKLGVSVRVSALTPDVVEAIVAIFNEVPTRQGKPMRHYGKTPEEIEEAYSDVIHTCDFLLAELDGQIIGFILLVYAGDYAYTAQIMSLIAYRNKYPNNALIAKAVEVCADRQIPYLVYTKWYDQGVTEFKRRNGFEKVDLPRYFVPLNWKGRWALRTGLHKGLRNLVPPGAKAFLRRRRNDFYRVFAKQKPSS